MRKSNISDGVKIVLMAALLAVVLVAQIGAMIDCSNKGGALVKTLAFPPWACIEVK